MIRAIICEDEKPARLRLTNLITKEPDINIVGEANNGKSAIEIINTLIPDVVFLDIQMPEFTGIEVLEKLTNKPYIIFITAYDKFAIKAFELNSLDYILKPYTNERFKDSLNRLRTNLKNEQKLNFNKKIDHLLKEYSAINSAYNETIIIREEGIETSIYLSDVFYFQSYSNYLKIHLNNNEYLYRNSLEKIEQELNPNSFLHIHRSYIINKSFILQSKYLTNNEYQFELTNGHSIKSGRSYSKQISDFLSKTV